MTRDQHDELTVTGRPSRPVAFWLGVFLIALGVLMHLADYIEVRAMKPTGMFMPMGFLGIAGMVVDLLGLVMAAWGLLPRDWLAGRRTACKASAGSTGNTPSRPANMGLAAMDAAPMTGAHWRMMVRLFVGLALDTMKPATIGFMLPGLREEYGLVPAEASLLPFFALVGTTVGSVAFGLLGDLVGRRASFILTALILAATSICGLMPGFGFQLAMCFIMGLAAGGELPVIYTLLAEAMPARHRGWLSVVVGGLGGLCGFLAASAAALVLEPNFGWRVLFVLNLPTALFMLLVIGWVPESPRFLIQIGRLKEAGRVMADIGVPLDRDGLHIPQGQQAEQRGISELFRGKLLPTTAALCLYGFAWGLCNWGFITWLPSMLRDLGQDAATANRLLTTSALFAVPGTLAAAALYGLWSSRKSAVLFAWGTAGMLALFGLAQPLIAGRPNLIALLVIGLLIASNSMIGVLTPYSVELYPTALRGLGSGVVAASTKSGGIVGPALVGTVLTLTPGLTMTALLISLPLATAGILMAWRGAETRGRRLEELGVDVG